LSYSLAVEWNLLPAMNNYSVYYQEKNSQFYENLIKKYHIDAEVEKYQLDNEIVLSINSNAEKDYYNILPKNNHEDSSLTPEMQRIRTIIQRYLSRDIKLFDDEAILIFDDPWTSDEVDVSQPSDEVANISFDDLLQIVKSCQFIKKCLILVDEEKIIVGGSNDSVATLTRHGIDKFDDLYCFDLDEGFYHQLHHNKQSVTLNYLQKAYENWKTTNCQGDII
jgi:hypothetical protein